MNYINKDYWDGFYKNKPNLLEASTFSQFIYGEIKEDIDKYFLVDLGCGTGKDTFYFANKKIQVLGIDGSIEVININKSRIESEFSGLSSIRFKCVDLSNENELNTVMSKINEMARLNNKKVLFYTRFFLHAIPEEVESLILDSITRTIERPYVFVAEFRTKEDEALEKVYADHYRRYVDTDVLIGKMLNYGYSLKAFTKGRGYSVYKNENPYLARLIMEKN